MPYSEYSVERRAADRERISILEEQHKSVMAMLASIRDDIDELKHMRLSIASIQRDKSKKDGIMIGVIKTATFAGIITSTILGALYKIGWIEVPAIVHVQPDNDKKVSK